MTEKEINELISDKTKTRRCSKCRKDRTLDLFFIKKEKNPKYFRFNSPCKICMREHNKQRKDYLRNYHLIRNFGISEDQYNEILEKQDGKCKICNKHPSVKKLAVDHCHKTGKIRGLLCEKCNTGLGMFKDDITNLRSAISYIRKSK